VPARLELRAVSWLYLALLAAAVVVLVGAEWPRLASRFGLDARRRRDRERRKKSFRVVQGEEEESEEFARSVERDLAKLPTIEEGDRR
jgi:hypothetical protein